MTLPVLIYRVLPYQKLYFRSIPCLLAASRYNKFMARYQHTCSSSNSEVLSEVKSHAKKIFDAGVESVLPERMVKSCLKLQENILTVKNRSYMVDHNVHVVGFGKAVIGMVTAVDQVLGDHIVGGVASIPVGIQKALTTAGKQDILPNKSSKVKLIEGAKDNLPDESAQEAANQIAEIARNLTDKDLLIVLLSGGGSALLPSPIPPITLEDKHQVTKVLAKKGATITELNTIRKNLSTLKGGGLAQLAYPAQVVALVLSDIIGDPIDLIAGAPTVADSSTPSDCLDIIERLEIKDDIPKSIMKYLTEKAECRSEGQKSDFDHVMNIIVGSNTIAVRDALEEAERLKYVAVAYSMSVAGEARVIGEMYSSLAALMYQTYCIHSSYKGQESEILGMANPQEYNHFLLNMKMQLLCLQLRNEYGVKASTLEMISKCAEMAANKKQPLCIIGAGETVVTVVGDGKGGRNQELALSAAISMNNSQFSQPLQKEGFQLVLMSAGTDGQDGPTDATGAFAYPGQLTGASQSCINAKKFLDNNDSYSFYKELHGGSDLIITGLTGNNVMDLQILLLKPPK